MSKVRDALAANSRTAVKADVKMPTKSSVTAEE